MDTSGLSSLAEKALPVVAFIAGLFADWCKQRITSRFEQKRHLSRVIADLLDLRYRAICLIEAPKQIQNAIPDYVREQIPKEAWQQLDFSKMLPSDDKLGDRYRNAVDEIASFDPLLAYQLRGKERFFDFRNGLSKFAGNSPDGLRMLTSLREILDREFLPVIEETLLDLAKCHGWRTAYLVRRKLKSRLLDSNPVSSQLKAHFEELAVKMQIVPSPNKTGAGEV